MPSEPSPTAPTAPGRADYAPPGAPADAAARERAGGGAGRRWAVLAVVALGVLILDAGVAWWLRAEVDRPLLALVIRARSPVLDRVAVAVTDAGSPGVMTAVAATAVVVLVLARRFRVAAGYAVAAAAGGELSPLLKAATDRARPPAADRLVTVSGSAFPSGHALGTTVVLGLLVLVLPARVQPAQGRGDGGRPRVSGSTVPVVVAAVVAAAVGVSRVLLGVHWPTDVVAGWALGVLWVSLVALTARALASLTTPRLPGRAPMSAPYGTAVADGPVDGPAGAREPATGGGDRWSTRRSLGPVDRSAYRGLGAVGCGPPAGIPRRATAPFPPAVSR